ncbi:hypothetical protein 043JT007_67 [Bacillus phage 043JT007]|nr:hypothetical protein 043JT007_67 [Bacillus phage 043JT007]
MSSALTKKQLAVLLGCVTESLKLRWALAGEQGPEPEDLSRVQEFLELMESVYYDPTPDNQLTFEEMDELFSLLLDMHNAEGRTEEELDLMNQPPSSPYIH